MLKTWGFRTAVLFVFNHVKAGKCLEISTHDALAIAEATGEGDFRKVSTHDLCRRFAQRLLADEQMNPRVVMTVGGWESFAAIEPYLNAPSEDVIDEAFRGVPL